MRIRRGVSYHPYADDKVYVHNVETQKDYILEGSALDILDCLKKHADCSFDELFEWLAELYEIEEIAEFEKDLQEFIEELFVEKILTEFDTDDAEEIWTREIAEEVEKYFAEFHKLYSLSLELTYRCVEKCIHCYIDNAQKFCSNDELTTNEVKSILKQARKMGCIKILLTGGEILLRADFCDIVEYAINLGLIVDVYTTGIGLTDKIFDRLCAAKVNSVSFSLYSGIADEHDAITNVKGSFEKTLKAMMMFKCAGVQTFIKCVALRQNFNSLESVYKLGKRLNLRVSISPRITSGHEHKRACDYHLNAEQYEKFFLLESRYINIDPEDYSAQIVNRLKNPPCSAGLNGISIDPFGGVHNCIAFSKSFGSLREDTLKNLWKKVPRLPKLRELTSKCCSCRLVEFCHVCPGELLKSDKTIKTIDCGDTLVMAKARAKVIKSLRRRSL